MTSTPAVPNQQGTTVVLNQNHINSAISNGASTIPSQKHEGVANGESMNVLHSEANKSVSINSALQSSITSTNVSQTVSNSIQAQVAASTYLTAEGTATTNITHQSTNITKSNDTVKLIYPQGNPSMTSTGAIITNRVAFPAQTVPNGSIGLSPLTPHTVQSKQSAIVIKTSGNHTNAPGLVSVPMSSAASSIQQQQQHQQQHINSVVCSSAASAATLQNIMTLAKPMSQTVVSSQNLVQTSQQTTAILPSNVQILNVRPGVQGPQPQKGAGTAGGGGAVQSRVVLSAPQMVGARPGQPVSRCTPRTRIV